MLQEGGVDVTDFLKSSAAAQARESIGAKAEQAKAWLAKITDAAIGAAVRGAFLPSDLGLVPGRRSRNAELDRILSHSEVVLTDSQKAWQLRPEARRSILLQAQHDARLTHATESIVIEDEDAKSRDGEGRLLRQLLAGFEPDLRTLETADLIHLATVSEWLTGTSLAKLPPTKEFQRLIALRELLDPFRTLVGRSVAAGSDGSQDRFVGRTQELERLRQYVGIVPPDQLISYVNRTWSSLWTTLSRSNANTEPLRIEGIGGMGKSTLLAKFVLDHALFPGVNLPFVYLDFDRAALAPRQPMQLLIDIALQIEAWFPELEPKLTELRDQLRSSIDGLASNINRRIKEEQTRTELRACCASLRQIIETVNQARAPVVVLFDTFEVVQYDQEAVSGVLSLIAALRMPTSQMWSNLRIVVAGRAEMPEIESSLAPLKVGRLSHRATIELIQRRNQADSLDLASAQINALARPLRNSPLDVVIVMNWLKGREPSERARLVQSLLEEVADPGTEDQSVNSPLMTQRITGILINRMVNHINDPHVRELVNPGLVVRTVTPEVIRHVMAPACGLAALEPNAEKQLFKRLEQERWLVTRRGNAIRHRPEVRAAMLDLLRRQDFSPDRNKQRANFSQTNAMAIAFFRERAASSSEMRAECIYHMLLGGRAAFDDVEALWTSDVASFLQNAVDDLIGLSQAYLRLKLGRYGQVTPEQIVQLSDRVPSLIATSGRRLFRNLPPETTLNLLARTLSSTDHSSMFGVKLEALYRSGRWAELEPVTTSADTPARTIQALMSLGRGDFESLAAVGEEARLPLRVLLRWAARGPHSMHPYLVDFARREEAPERALQIEDIGWDLTVFLLCANARGTQRDLAGPAYDVTGTKLLDQVAAQCRSTKRLPKAATESGALRILAFFETGRDRAVLKRVDFESHFSVVSGRERQQLEVIVSDSDRLSETDAGRDAVARSQSALERMSPFDPNIVIADTSMTAEFVAAVRGLAEAGDQRVSQSLLRMLSLKHPDWLEPIGHALTRAFQGAVPTRLGMWSSVETFFGTGSRRKHSKPPSTGQEILSLADEAAHLREALNAYDELVQKQTRNDDVRQFRALVRAFDGWSAMLTEQSRASTRSGSSQRR